MENSETIKECDFLNFYNNRLYNANCFNTDGSLNKNYNSFKSTGIIASIFEDHWDKTYLDNKPIIDKYRPNATVEVQKIIDCYNKNLGCSLYECPHCHDIIFIGHTCKSRFCSSCGYKYKNDRVENILQTAYNCNHRQIVFTIPKQLRSYFFFHFSDRINLLFKAVRNTIYSILNESFKKNKLGILKKYPIHSKMIPLIKHHCRNFRKQLLKYQLSISIAFHRNPYHCPKCDTKMILSSVLFRNEVFLCLILILSHLN